MKILGLEWYWWLAIIATVALSIPFKIRFLRWWNQRQQERGANQEEKWGNDE